MSNISKKGLGNEGHGEPLAPTNFLGKMATKDTIEGVERTNRVKEGTYIGCEYSLENIKGDGGVLSDSGTSKNSILTS